MSEAVSFLSRAELNSERRGLRRKRWISLLLAFPVLAFIVLIFAAPITSMLYRSVYNPVLAELIPQTLEQLEAWDDSPLPPDAAYATLAGELKVLAVNRQAGQLAAAVNRAWPGASSLINSTARKMRTIDADTLAREGTLHLRSADARWQDPGLWRAIRAVGSIYTLDHYLTALDLERNESGAIQQRDSARIYLQLYGKSLEIALTITALCLLLGYPLAYYLAHAPRRIAGALMVLVLLPFWTSFLVRTTAWIALLQANGVINSTLQALGFTSAPLELLYTRYATVLAMTHVLLPFMILPLYSVMRGIDPSYFRAAISLGSRPWAAFVRVYLPMTLPGLSAGALLVFIVSVGYYIIPALVGGTDGQMISNIIAFHMQRSNNWGLAAALGALLLALILVLYWLYDRLVGTQHIKLG